MALEVRTWNIKNAFSDEARAESIKSDIIKHRPDAIFLMEAYSKYRAEMVPDIAADFESEGYDVAYDLYGEDEDNAGWLGMMFLARREAVVKPTDFIRLSGRNAVKAALKDGEGNKIDTFGINFDYRNPQRRLAMAKELLRFLEVDERNKIIAPTVVAGNPSALESNRLTSRALRHSKPLIDLLPSSTPRALAPLPTWRHRFHLLKCLSEMASCGTLEQLESYGLRSADHYDLPNMPAFRPLISLSKIMVSENLAVKLYDVGKRNFAADDGRFRPAIDHRYFSAAVELEPAAN